VDFFSWDQTLLFSTLFLTPFFSPLRHNRCCCSFPFSVAVHSWHAPPPERRTLLFLFSPFFLFFFFPKTNLLLCISLASRNSHPQKNGLLPAGMHFSYIRTVAESKVFFFPLNTRRKPSPHSFLPKASAFLSNTLTDYGQEYLFPIFSERQVEKQSLFPSPSPAKSRAVSFPCGKVGPFSAPLLNPAASQSCAPLFPLGAGIRKPSIRIRTGSMLFSLSLCRIEV